MGAVVGGGVCSPAFCFSTAKGGMATDGRRPRFDRLFVLGSSVVSGVVITDTSIIHGVTQALSEAFRSWLDENRREIAGLVAATITASGSSFGQPDTTRSPAPRFLTTAQLAARWNIHAETVRRMSRRGVLPATRIGKGLLIPTAAVERYEAAAGGA
jgi:excisionase family DNA binding protein